MGGGAQQTVSKTFLELSQGISNELVLHIYTVDKLTIWDAGGMLNDAKGCTMAIRALVLSLAAENRTELGIW